jgi:hypothetical protein
VEATVIHCRYCENEHGNLLLCPPAKRVLDALAERGQRFDMPTIEFPEPVMHAGDFGGGTVLVQNVVVKAGTVPVSGVSRPVLIFTGRDIEGHPLPEWLYPGSDEELQRVCRLVTEMTDMAIRRARQERKGQS